LAVVGVVLLIAWAGKLGLNALVRFLETHGLPWLAGLHLVSSLPLFLYALLAAVLAQVCADVKVIKCRYSYKRAQIYARS
jgi:hypothetical protein